LALMLDLAPGATRQATWAGFSDKLWVVRKLGVA
jgi:hypothetical protein